MQGIPAIEVGHARQKRVGYPLLLNHQSECLIGVGTGGGGANAQIDLILRILPDCIDINPDCI